MLEDLTCCVCYLSACVYSPFCLRRGIIWDNWDNWTINFCTYPSATEKEEIDILSMYILNSYINNNIIINFYIY